MELSLEESMPRRLEYGTQDVVRSKYLGIGDISLTNCDRFWRRDESAAKEADGGTVIEIWNDKSGWH